LRVCLLRVWCVAKVLNGSCDIFLRMSVCFMRFAQGLVCGQGLERNFILIELCCHSHTVLHRHLKPVDILLEEIVLCQCFGRHAKLGISPSGLEIFEELQTFLNL
jgi:serine/threonine protein kinase